MKGMKKYYKKGKMNFVEGLSVSAAKFTERVTTNSGGMTANIARRTAGMKRRK